MAKRKKILGWTIQPSPKHLKQGSGWFGDMEEMYISNDRQYAVMVRNFTTDIGNVSHACIRNQGSIETNWEGTDIPWAEKQRIKNAIFGEEAYAIEVYPKMSQLIDAANMYHIWVLHDYKLPFGLKAGEE